MYKPAINHTITQKYSDDQLVVVPRLTDAEVCALSWAYFDKQFMAQKFEDMTKTGKPEDKHVISGWRDITPAHDAERLARIREAMMSLDRFGLCESYYEHGPRSQDRIVETEDDGTMWVSDIGWRWKLNEQGIFVQAAHRANWYKCCDGCVHLPCVCREKTFCAVHGGGCHGNHD